MSQILQPYEIALLHNDLTSEETYNDVFHSLMQLTQTVDDIFNRIDKRLGNYIIIIIHLISLFYDYIVKVMKRKD